MRKYMILILSLVVLLLMTFLLPANAVNWTFVDNVTIQENLTVDGTLNSGSTTTFQAAVTINDSVNLYFGDDTSTRFGLRRDSSTGRFMFETNQTGSAMTDTDGMFTIHVAKGGTLDAGQHIFVLRDDGTVYAYVDQLGNLHITGEFNGAGFNSTGIDNTFGINVMNTADPTGAYLEGGLMWFNSASNTLKQRSSDNTATIQVNTNSKDFAVYNYSASYDNVVKFKADTNWVLTQLDCLTGGADTVVVTLYECDGNATNCSTTGLSVTASSTNATDSSASNGSIDITDWVVVNLTSLSGTPTSLACSTRYIRVGN